MSAVCSAGSGLCLWLSGTRNGPITPWLLVIAAALVQARLLCNLFDGMVAVEGGFKTKSGEIFNELPDRFADVFIFAGAGYATPEFVWSPLLGWVAAIAAVLTAYVRALGASAGASQHFYGPMAKQNRMAVMTAACLGTSAIQWSGGDFSLLPWSLILIGLGSIVTLIRRTVNIIAELESK